MISRARRFKNKLKQHFHDLLKVKTSPHSIALGFAIGTFIAIIPTLSLDLLIGLIIVLLFKQINKISLFGAMIIWNPITLIPIHLLSYKLGGSLLGNTPVIKYEVSLIDQIFNLSKSYLLGNLILAVTISVLSYFLVKEIAKAYQRKHRED